MESLYLDFLGKKETGDLPAWDSITSIQLRDLYRDSNIIDRDIAALFSVTINQVRGKRKRHGLSKSKIHMMRMLEDNNNVQLQEMNEEAKNYLLSDELFDRVVIGLAHYIFRNGPVEDMHTNDQLSDNDMKTLNKFVADQIGRVLFLAKEGRWFELQQLLAFNMLCGQDWDKPNIDMDDLYTILALEYDMEKRKAKSQT